MSHRRFTEFELPEEKLDAWPGDNNSTLVQPEAPEPEAEAEVAGAAEPVSTHTVEQKDMLVVLQGILASVGGKLDAVVLGMEANAAATLASLKSSMDGLKAQMTELCLLKFDSVVESQNEMAKIMERLRNFEAALAALTAGRA